MPADSLIVPAIMDTSVTRLRRVLPGEAGADITALQQLLAQSVADSAWPGGVLLAARDGQIFVHEAFGYHSIAGREKTHRSDIFDLASLTKVLATTLGYMQLYAADPTILDAPAMQYLPEFGAEPSDQRNMKRLVTIRQLLTHTSGLPAGAAYWKIGASLEDRLAAVYATPLDTLPGARYLYSDTGFILLGKILESITGLSLATYLDSMVYQPLQLETTGFNPSGERISRIVPTEIGADTDEAIRGYVHDENAHSLGGVAGHAGLFSSARDLAVLAQTLLNGGRYGDIRVFDSAAVELFTSRANIIEGSSRCLGWDQPAGEASAGVYASSSSFGHTGFTGTSFWVDPDNNLFVILLTNAVHPTRAAKTPKYYDWRQRIHSAVYESLPDHTRNPDLILKKRWQHE